eukprot:TRINITY_DN11394_c0_g2_i1.p1 TRINITY_DN11394_c0_g2~~TRINITY_DN11394_c0_g2_i1.p1  ORF type:complete len:289 (+),score=73.66 TRINITY_DN11394_c0_g2_i1:85-951(+)
MPRLAVLVIGASVLLRADASAPPAPTPPLSPLSAPAPAPPSPPSPPVGGLPPNVIPNFKITKPAAPPAPPPQTPTAADLQRAAEAAAAAEAARVQQERNSNLRSAVPSGNLAGIQAMIAARADVNHRIGEGHTPLHILMDSDPYEGDHYACAVELMKGGADINIKDSRGRTPLFYAAQGNIREMVLLFSQAEDKDTHDNYRVSALNYAVRENLADSVKALLEIRADPHFADAFGGTAMMAAKNANSVIQGLMGLQATTTTTAAPYVASPSPPLYSPPTPPAPPAAGGA